MQELEIGAPNAFSVIILSILHFVKAFTLHFCRLSLTAEINNSEVTK